MGQWQGRGVQNEAEKLEGEQWLPTLGWAGGGLVPHGEGDGGGQSDDGGKKLHLEILKKNCCPIEGHTTFYRPNLHFLPSEHSNVK